jgi:hypothetical protein
VIEHSAKEVNNTTAAIIYDFKKLINNSGGKQKEKS